MIKERRKKVNVTDVLTEKRALIGNVLAGLGVLFLGYIATNITTLTTSSKVQERELINMNRYFTVILEIQSRKLDGHIGSERMHPYKTSAHYKTKYSEN